MQKDDVELLILDLLKWFGLAVVSVGTVAFAVVGIVLLAVGLNSLLCGC